MRRACMAVLILGVAATTVHAGERCVKRPPPSGPIPLESPKVVKPTLKQLKAAITKQTAQLGGAVGYELAYGGDDTQRTTCETSLGRTGTATTTAQLAALASCLWQAPAITAGADHRVWKIAVPSKLPGLLRGHAADVTGFGKNHLVATAVLDSKKAREGDVDYYAVFVAHREGETVVVDAVYTAERLWTK